MLLQLAKRKALGGDPDSMSDVELWQQIVRCLHAARKKVGEQSACLTVVSLATCIDGL